MTTRATTSSTTTTVSMNARSRSGNLGPTSASIPSANAVSVDIAAPQPCAPERPAFAARERVAGRRRAAPAWRAGRACVRGEVDADRHRHAAEPGEHRQRDASPLPQLPHVELAASLETDDEEEKRHQAAVHPVAEIESD